jgi:regulatory protein
MNDDLNAADDAKELMKAKSDALRLFSFSARSSTELRKRLEMKKIRPELIEQVIESFTRQGLLDDTKFAKLYAESRLYSRPTGKKNLEIDLKRKGLSPELISQTMAGLKDYDEKAMAKELIRVRFHKMTDISAEKKKARLIGFVKRRGFATDAIFSAMNELFKEDLSVEG